MLTITLCLTLLIKNFNVQVFFHYFLFFINHFYCRWEELQFTTKTEFI